MGLLDDLRQQTETKKAAEQQEGFRKEKAEEYYREKIQPQLKKLYTHYSEITKHLNYVKLETKATYIVNAAGQTAEFQQGDYKIQVDSMDATTFVSIRCKCNRNSNIEFMVTDPSAINKHKAFLNQFGFDYQTYPRNNNEPGARFSVVPEIVAELLFEVNKEQGKIILKVINFEELGVRVRELRPDDINDTFMDGLDRFIIRENKDFFKLGIDDKAKEEIRAMVQQEQRRRAEELKEMERLAQEEALREKMEKENKGIKKGIKLVQNIPVKKLFKHG